MPHAISLPLPPPRSLSFKGRGMMKMKQGLLGRVMRKKRRLLLLLLLLLPLLLLLLLLPTTIYPIRIPLPMPFGRTSRRIKGPWCRGPRLKRERKAQIPPYPLYPILSPPLPLSPPPNPPKSLPLSIMVSSALPLSPYERAFYHAP